MGRVALLAWLLTACVSYALLGDTLGKLVEGYDREQLTKMAPAIASELAAPNMGLTAQASCVYDLVFYIRPAPTAAA